MHFDDPRLGLNDSRNVTLGQRQPVACADCSAGLLYLDHDLVAHLLKYNAANGSAIHPFHNGVTWIEPIGEDEESNHAGQQKPALPSAPPVLCWGRIRCRDFDSLPLFTTEYGRHSQADQKRKRDGTHCSPQSNVKAEYARRQ